MKEPLSITAADFDYIRNLVREQSALALEPGKEYLVESRLEPLSRREGFSSFHEMVKSLRLGPLRELHRKVVEAMTNNETSFFRDARVFRMLASGILPALVAERAAERAFNIWCAASSSGQEPYSLAMLIHEHRPSLHGWNIRVIASDISRDALARAQAGRYTQFEVNRGLPANLLVKYFAQHGSAWEVRPEIRRMVEFREINLIQSWPAMPGIHLILMRNVLIYFDVEVKKAILERAGRVLDSRGYLLLGGAESTTNLNETFEPVTVEGAVCFQRRQADSPTARCPAPSASKMN
jgi:chemotaxis protein methyltransferase CheR